MNYTIQVVEFIPQGYHGILIVDNDTGEFLRQRDLERWIRLIGGEQIDHEFR